MNKFIQGLCSPCSDQAIFTGVSDVIVVKNNENFFKSTAFYCCFGAWDSTNIEAMVTVAINNKPIGFSFSVMQNGFIFPYKIPSETISTFGLQPGRNTIEYKLQYASIAAQIYLYGENEQLVISDVDGTVTISNVPGIVSNYFDKHYIHPGYEQLIQQLDAYGYRIVWLSMRCLPLYNMTKKYIRQFIKIDGPLLTEPEQFVNASKKEVITGYSDVVKTSIIQPISEIFPKSKNPLAGGLGNTKNDAIAYHYVGVPLDSIFIVDTKSKVQRMSDTKNSHSYESIAKDLEIYFPKISKPRVTKPTAVRYG